MMREKMKSMSNYQIRFADFYTEKKIPKSAKKMINEAIVNRLMIDPNRYGKLLIGNLKNHRRLRVSYYRIVYQVDDNAKVVTIKAIDYRKIAIKCA